MAFALKRRESVRDGLVRLSAAQLSRATASLRNVQSGHVDIAVHDARVRLKRVRALLALVRDSMPEARLRSGELKAIARTLAGARDPSSMLDAFMGLSDRFGSLDPLSFARVECALRDRVAAAQHGAFPGAVLASALGALEAAAAGASEWDIHGHGFVILRDGLERSYRTTRASRRGALAGDASARHRWRVRVKRLADQLALVRPVWPAVMGSHIRVLRKIGEGLGEDHDLWLLSGVLLESPREFGDPEPVRAIARLATLVGREHVRRLRRPARRALAETPGAFVSRVQALWHAWRP